MTDDELCDWSGMAKEGCDHCKTGKKEIGSAKADHGGGMNERRTRDDDRPSTVASIRSRCGSPDCTYPGNVVHSGQTIVKIGNRWWHHLCAQGIDATEY